MKIENKKGTSLFTDFLWYLLWWKTDTTKLEEQAKSYTSKPAVKSFRGISALLLLFSAGLTSIFVFLGLANTYSLVDVVLLLVLAYLVYKGKGWAMLLSMMLISLERGFNLVQQFGPGLNFYQVGFLFTWWALYMRFLYAAYKVERIRRQDLTFNNPEVPTEQQKATPDSSKTSFTETTPKVGKFFKGIRWDRRILYILVPILLLGSAFYWFEVRPAKIRHDCSWKKVHIPAIEARAARGPEECMESAYLRLQGIETGNPKMCPGSPAISAQPARDEWQRVSSEEYKFCLHDHGL